MSNNSQLYGTPFAATATGSTSSVATVSGVDGVRRYVTDVSGSSDKVGALILVKNGSTVIWQDRVSSTAAYRMTFVTPLQIASGSDCTVTVDGTLYSAANVAGYSI